MCLELQFGILQGIELVVPALLLQQFLVAAVFQDLAGGQQDDVVLLLDGGQPGGNDQHGADVLHLCQRILD